MSGAYSLVVMHVLLVAVASPVVELRGPGGLEVSVVAAWGPQSSGSVVVVISLVGP